MTNKIWTEKYRPDTLKQVKSQEHILTILKQIIKSGEVNNNILFYGLPGTGKTSCMKTFAKEYYGKNYKNMILELNASDNRGINVVRNIIADFVNSKMFFSDKKKMIILDEADSMTPDAQNLLISLMESSASNIIFCFICNYINKMTIAISSRCLCFRFSKIKYIDMSDILKTIAKEENIKLENDKVLEDIYKFGKGDMRKCINIFQNIIEGNELKHSNIYKIFNYPTQKNIEFFIEILLNNEINISNSFKKINSIILDNQLLLKNIVNEITVIINKENKIKDINRYLYILTKLGDIEYNLTNDYNHRIQLYGLISIFKIKIN